MTPDQRFLAIGIYINSALYLAGCFAAGLITNHPVSWKLALVATGTSYIAYYVQVAALPRMVINSCVAISIIAGVAAGLALLG